MADGPAVRERIRELLDGGADTPLRVDAAGAPDPAHLARLRAAMDAAAAAGDFRLATGLQDFLFAGVAHWFPSQAFPIQTESSRLSLCAAVEPKPSLTLEQAVGGETLVEKGDFFFNLGCFVVARLFDYQHLARLQ